MAFPTLTVSVGVQETTSDTTATVTIPAVASGDRLIILFATDGASITFTWPSGGNPAWTEIQAEASRTGGPTTESRYRDIDGTEGWGSGGSIAVTLSASEAATATVVKVTAGTFDAATAPATGTAANGSSTLPNPPSLDPAGWGTEDTVWLAWCGYDLGTVTVTGYPADYADNQTNHRGNATAGCGIGLATRNSATASQDPGTFTLSATETWVANTIAIRPGSGDQTVSPALLGGAAIFAPTLLVDQSVSPGLLGGAAIFAPRIDQSVAVALLGGAAIFAPTLLVDQSVQPGLLGGAVVFAPVAVIDQTVSPALLGGAAIFAPVAVIDQTVSPALLGGAAIFAPTAVVGAFQSDAFQSDAFQADAFEPGQTVQPGLLGGAVVFAITRIDQTVQPGLLGGAAIFAPAVLAAQTVSPGLLGGATIFAPGATVDQSVQPGLLGGATIFATTRIDQTVQPGLLGGAVVFAITRIDQTVTGVLLGSAVIYAPAVSEPIAPLSVSPGLLGGATIIAPQVFLGLAQGAGQPVVEYVIELLDDTASFGPNAVQGEVWDARNVGWSRYDRIPGKAFFTLPQSSPHLGKVVPFTTHVRFWRLSGLGATLVYQGTVIDTDSTGDDVVVLCFDYLASLSISRSGYRVLYPNKLLGSEIVSPEWELAKGATSSPLGFVSTGTIEDPLGADDTTPIKTNTQFGLLDQMRLQLFYDLSEMGRANTDHHVTFEITRSLTPAFRLLKDKGSDVGLGLTLNGNVTDYRHLPNWIGYRNDLATLGTTTGGGATEIIVKDDAAAAARGRRQDVFTVKTLLGIVGLATEADQQKAVAERMLRNTLTLQPTILLRILPNALEPFNGWDICDKAPVEIGNGLDAIATRWRIVGVRAFYDGEGERPSVIVSPVVT